MWRFFRKIIWMKQMVMNDLSLWCADLCGQFIFDISGAKFHRTYRRLLAISDFHLLQNLAIWENGYFDIYPKNERKNPLFNEILQKWRNYFQNVDSFSQNFRKIDLDLKSGHFLFRNSRMWIFFELFPKSGYFWYVLRDYP